MCSSSVSVRVVGVGNQVLNIFDPCPQSVWLSYKYVDIRDRVERPEMRDGGALTFTNIHESRKNAQRLLIEGIARGEKGMRGRGREGPRWAEEAS